MVGGSDGPDDPGQRAHIDRAHDFALRLWIVAEQGAGEGVVFLGDSPLMQEIASHLEAHPEKGLTPLGFLDDANSHTGKRLGSISDLCEVVGRIHPKRIVVGLQERRSHLPVAQLLELRLSGIRIEDALSSYEMAFERISTHELRPSQLIFSSSELGPSRTSVRLQMAYSMAIASIAVVVTAPVMLLVVALVKLTSPGPALLRQRRVEKITAYSRCTNSGRWCAMRRRAAALYGPPGTTRV